MIHLLCHQSPFEFNTSYHMVEFFAILILFWIRLLLFSSGERIASPSEELNKVDSNTNPISHSDAAGSSHSYKSE